MSDRSTRHPPLSRADQLRQQRQQPSRVPVMPTKKPEVDETKPQVVNPFGRGIPQPDPKPTRQAAVITSRTYPYSTPLRQSVGSAPRRKAYHVSSDGVETRMPALPALHFSWQWVSGFMTIVFTTAVFLMLYLPIFEVNRIQVDGLTRVSTAEVTAVIQKNTGSIFTLDTQRILNAVGLAFPELTDVKLKANMTGALTLSAAERQPILMWFAGDTTYWIDEKGVVMTPRGDPGPLKTISSQCSVPVDHRVAVAHNAVEFINLVLDRQANPLTPQDVISTVRPDVLNAVLEMSTLLPGGASLVYDEVAGIGWQDPAGWKVYFGTDLENIQFKEVEYQTIVTKLAELGMTPTMISVEHVDAPYFKTK